MSNQIIQLADANGNSLYPVPHAVSVTATPASGVTVTRSSFYMVGNVLHIAFNVSVGSDLASGAVLFTLPSTVSAVADQDFTMTNTSGSTVYGYMTGNAIRTRYALTAARYVCNATVILS